jgi:hypothetical protein
MSGQKVANSTTSDARFTAGVWKLTAQDTLSSLTGYRQLRNFRRSHMHGPTQRNQDGAVLRNDGEVHAGSARSQIHIRDTAYFFRLTLEEFRAAQRLILGLGFRGRADAFMEAVTLMALIAKAAADAGYRDREEFVARSIQALNCLEKRSAIPTWAHLEAAPALLPAPTAEPSKA